MRPCKPRVHRCTAVEGLLPRPAPGVFHGGPPPVRNAASISSSRAPRTVRASTKSNVTSARKAVDVETARGGEGSLERVVYDGDGWNFWDWSDPQKRSHRIHYIQAGEAGPPLVLVHGFGASAYHWRHNIPELARTHRVFAVCLLGFGWSDKAIVDYTGDLWAEQLRSFIREVVHADGAPQDPVVLAGNSLGGYAALCGAIKCPDLVRGVALLNSAGSFENTAAEGIIEIAKENDSALAAAWQSLVDGLKRISIYAVFYTTKQPARVKQVLSSVYVNQDMLDDALVTSILQPAQDRNAPEVFYRVINSGADKRRRTINQLLRELRVPLHLVWGEKDPWIVPARAQQILDLYQDASVVYLPSGHCPHDDSPEDVNAALTRWIADLPTASAGEV